MILINYNILGPKFDDDTQLFIEVQNTIDDLFQNLTDNIDNQLRTEYYTSNYIS